jgi:hypothetical protein
VAVANDVATILSNIGSIVGSLGRPRAIAPVFAQFLSILIQIAAIFTEILSLLLNLSAIVADVARERHVVKISALKRRIRRSGQR